MDLNWQNDIINGLILENPESTIKDYLILLEELAAIERGERELPGYRPGPIKTKWPCARLTSFRGPALTKGERAQWQHKDQRFHEFLKRGGRQL